MIIKDKYIYAHLTRLCAEMAAAVIVSRRNKNEAMDINNDPGAKAFVETLPPVEFRERDTVMGTLLLG